MTELATFRYDDSPIRAVVIGGNPWFVASDVAVVLGYRDAHNAARLLDDDDRGTHLVSTPGGQQRVTVISEPGLYMLTMRSDMPDARRFQRWVTRDVLPEIRKTGRYEVAPAIPRTFAEALRLAADQHERAEREAARVAELAPRAAQADQHRAADGHILVGDFANKLKAWALREHGVRVLHAQVWDFLGEIGLIIRGNTVRKNHPTAFAVERDFVRLKETEYETNHGTAASTSPRLTPAGEGWAWDRAVRRIADHGSLKPTTAIERTS